MLSNNKKHFALALIADLAFVVIVSSVVVVVDKQHYARGISKCNLQCSFTLDLCFTKLRARKSHDYCNANVFEKFRFQTVFRPHLNAKTACFSRSLSRNFEKGFYDRA